MSMCSNISCYIFLIFSLSFSWYVQGLNDFHADALDALLENYAFKSFRRPRTGVLHKASLPSNLSGMEVSVVRLRSGSFWTRGANFSGFHIPPRVMPVPYVQRLAIIYQNLGNWSSLYYHVPGFSMVTPVIGFTAYGASNLSANSFKKLNLNTASNSISIHFPHVKLAEDVNLTISCVAFGSCGSMYFSAMTLPNTCFTRRQGHFAMVIPLKRKERLQWKLWAIGIGFGFVGLVLMSLVGKLIFRLVRTKKIKKMQTLADDSMAFETVLVGRSKMPCAAVLRTQPVLENGYAP